MIGNKVIKALECCVKDDILEADNKTCLECPMNDDNACTFNLRKHTLDLINRQQAEIEKIKTSIKLADNYFSEGDFAKGITIVYRLAKWLDSEV